MIQNLSYVKNVLGTIIDKIIKEKLMFFYFFSVNFVIRHCKTYKKVNGFSNKTIIKLKNKVNDIH